MKKYAIFPDTEIEFDNDNKKISTYIRKCHEGVYYLWYIGLNSIGDPSFLLSRFHYDVYMTILYGKVDLNLTDIHGQPVFVVDPDQTPEEKRLCPI
jgi:hypothetical protein